MGKQSRNSEIWYFGPPNVRRQVRRERARLLSEGALSKEEAERIAVLWYPLTQTEEEKDQEEQEDNDALD